MGIEEDVEKLLRGESAEPDFISKSSEIGQESAYITEGLRADELRKRKWRPLNSMNLYLNIKI